MTRSLYSTVYVVDVEESGNSVGDIWGDVQDVRAYEVPRPETTFIGDWRDKKVCALMLQSKSRSSKTFSST